ncbi:EF-hand and coiled-coil domain-containing protein 1 isoform X1 [Corythoichthys intestinalis]|uniref:EF-hand and coiled-coil domain-containing protein 1 isoform X1 n=1 Tax=Corythoichthys intestinalis TaxID=161448 RepID=UPI0025A646E6|nr:EF-hand and coiled-coil domain-containing protein 1 isoform X1 [Corythoichthys intestinalis]
MERAALSLKYVQPWPRAARRSEWLRSALAHHHSPDPGVENEIVVLATGIDQYLQEVFHHLAYPNRDEKVSAEDFSTLCAVLGVTGAQKGKKTIKGIGDEGRGDEDEEEFRDVCSGLPCQITFKDFHSRLCGYFRVRSTHRGTGECPWRLPVTEETELVERHIKLRWPRVRRRKYVSFDLTRNQNGHSRSTAGTAAEDSSSEELAALRELVEDLRSALQGSDARCLALEVALRRERSHMQSAPISVSLPTTSLSVIQGKLVPTRCIKGQLNVAGGNGARRLGRRWDLTDPLLRELQLIRSSRDGQLEEAIKFNERLEEELRWAYQEVSKLQEVESSLRRENIKIRRRAEEAREALSLGLDRVRMIQEQAESVPQLQSRITQLEGELQHYRSGCVCLPEAASTRGVEAYCRTDAECLQRAVEGRAASDEEEEGCKGMGGEGQCCLYEVKKHISRSHDWGKGCQSQVVHQVISKDGLHNGHHTNECQCNGRCCSWKRQKQELSASCKGCEEKKPDHATDRAHIEGKEGEERLSLMEGKFRDVLMLLLELRKKKLSRRELGTIMMDTLDMCSNGEGPSQVLQVADALYMQLSSTDHVKKGVEAKGGEREGKSLLPSSGHQTSSTSPLVISC